ncbi:MAG: hypothetical protein KY396_02385, partial [Actinobacteria bacterium]|nr:hypothetical protein [Actinomycetota bacterium]
KKALLVLATAATVAFGVGASPAAAHRPGDEEGRPGHSDYGRLHIASHGPHGHGVGGHNPGTHRGYSFCNENSEHFGEPK